MHMHVKNIIGNIYMRCTSRYLLSTQKKTSQGNWHVVEHILILSPPWFSYLHTPTGHLRKSAFVC